MTAPGAAVPAQAIPALSEAARLVEPALERFLADRRAELAALDPSAATLVDEIRRLVDAGGKRIRPALCLWAFRAARGPGEHRALDAGIALELLHTSALIHDDVMDAAAERRGVPATHVRFAARAPAGTDAATFGLAGAILVGDLALVLADRAMRRSGSGEPAGELALRRFDRMRLEMAAGQFLDVSGSRDLERVAALKSGSYTAVGPVLIGTALAGAEPAVEAPLGVYARLVGEAFQLRDDLADGDAPAGAAGRVGDLVDRAVDALAGAPLEPSAADALVALADLLRVGGVR